MEGTTAGLRVRDTSVGARVIEVVGELTPASEQELGEAFARACDGPGRVVLLDFRELTYMNSGGIGLLVTLLVRAQREKRQLVAFGLSDHYRQIFELTRLDDAIAIHDDESGALAAVSSAR
jgi:anti-sigma B factor antagonist